MSGNNGGAGGRPSKYCPELANLICERIMTHDIGLKRLCEMYDDMPDRSNIRLWRHKYPEFRAQYAQAKSEQLEFLTEEILEIADDSQNDWMESFDKEGQSIGWKLNGDHVQRCKLRVDTRKWLASKLAPKIYGDKLSDLQNTQDLAKDVAARVAEINKQAEKDY